MKKKREEVLAFLRNFGQAFGSLRVLTVPTVSNDLRADEAELASAGLPARHPVRRPKVVLHDLGLWGPWAPRARRVSPRRHLAGAPGKPALLVLRGGRAVAPDGVHGALRREAGHPGRVHALVLSLSRAPKE